MAAQQDEERTYTWDSKIVGFCLPKPASPKWLAAIL